MTPAPVLGPRPEAGGDDAPADTGAPAICANEATGDIKITIAVTADVTDSLYIGHLLTGHNDRTRARVPRRDDALGQNRLRKLIAFDEDTFDKLKQLARDRMATFQELADEAFADLLKKHGIPIDLKDALRKSAALPNTAKPAGAKPKSAKKATRKK